MNLRMNFVATALAFGLSQSVSAAPSDLSSAGQSTNSEMSGEEMASCHALIHFSQSYNVTVADKKKVSEASRFFFVEGEKRLGEKFSDASLATAEKYVPALEETKRSSPERHLEVKMVLARDAATCLIKYEAQKAVKASKPSSVDIQEERKTNPAGAQALSCAVVAAGLNIDLGQSDSRISLIKGVMQAAARASVNAYGSQQIFDSKAVPLTIQLASELSDEKIAEPKAYEKTKSKLLGFLGDCSKLYPH